MKPTKTFACVLLLLGLSLASSTTAGWAQGNTWTTKASMPTARWSSSAGVINGVLYVAGGYNGSHITPVEAYTFATNTWASKASRGQVQTSPAYGVVNGILYVAGGTNTSVYIPDLWAYNPANDTWTQKASMSADRSTMGGGVINGLFYVVGGVNFSGVRSTLEVYNPATNTWTTKASLPTARASLAAGVVNGILYAVGGSNNSGVLPTVEAYDPTTNAWTTKASMPTARSYLAVEVVDGILYAIGGSDNSARLATVEAYNPTTNTWTTKASMSTTRAGLETVEYNGRLYAVGGWTGVNTPLATVEEYTPTTPAGDTWATKASMPTPRYDLAVGVVNGVLYAVGGYNSNSGVLSTVEAYDPTTNTWTTKTSMPTPRYGLAVGVINGVLYAVGGNNGSNFVATVAAYDPTTNTWTTKASMPTPRGGLAIGVINGVLYAVGGYNGSSYLSTVEAYDPTTNTWTTKTSMPTARYELAIGVVNGVLYAGGGWNGSPLSTAAAYDPATNTWVTASLPTARGYLAAGVVNGVLYAVGGWNGSSVLSTVEAYDPATNTWATKTSMPTARSDLAVGVVNGVLYAVGGNLSSALATNEAYTPPATTPGVTQPVTFTEVGASAGVNDSGNGWGVAWGDYDTDGDLDLYVANFNNANLLYRNNGNGTFTEVGASAGVADSGPGEGVAWGDYDNDGDLDLYLVNSNSANRLYRNNANGTFTEVGASAGVADSGPGVSVAWGDYDLDGDLDLYVANFNSANRLYRNNANGTFTEVGASAGVNDSGPGAGVAWGDYDNDGDLDLYVANEGGTNRLYRNNGNGTFTEVGSSAGVADSGPGEGVAWGDYDNDGDLDLYLANFNSANRLYRNNGNGTFTEVGASAGVDDSGPGAGVAWGDYDNDGDLDLYVVNFNSANRLYRNNGNGTFTEVGASTGADDNGIGLGATWGDYDNDGDLDLYVVNVGTPNRLYQNNGTLNQWLEVKLGGTVSNKSGIGARVTAVTGSTRQRRDVDGGSGYSSQPSLPVEFGFGSTATVDSLIIRWPSGTVQVQTNVATNQVLTVTEPSAVTDTTAPAAPTGMTASAGNRQVSLSWTANTESDLASYVLYRSLTNGFTPTSGNSIAQVNKPTTAFIDTGRTNGTTYYYRLAAVDSSGNKSSPSLQASATPTPGQVVGSGGGAVTDASGTTLTIPAGSLTSNTTITLTTIAESDSRAAIASGPDRLIGIGLAYEFTATPTATFSPAARLAFAYTASQLSTAGVTHPRHLRIYRKATPTDTTWTRVAVDSVNTTTGRVYIHLTGFSVYRLAAGRASQFSALASLPSATTSQAKRVAVTLVDGEPTTVGLAYRRGGTTAWQRLGMAATTASADSFAATIPAADVTDHGLELYVKATDGTGTSDSTAVSALRVAVSGLSVSVSTIGLAAADTGNVADTTFTQTQRSKFRMLSIPIALDGGRSAQTVLGSQLGIGESKTGRIFRWNGAGYSEVTSESMDPGKAFWVISRTPPSAITVGAGQSSDTRSPPSLSINQNGFTQIGVPYTFAVPYDSIRIHNPTLDSRAWRWTGSGYTEVTTRLEPWQGYWIKNTGTASSITLPPVDADALPKPLPPLTSPTEPDGWTIRVVAEAGGMQDVDNYLGVSPQAAEQWDPLDFAEPPPLGAGTVALYVPHPEWPAPLAGQYAGDFRPANAEGYAWDVTVEAGVPRTTATVTVRDVDKVPPGFTALLIDLDHYRELNLRERALLTFPTGETGSTRHFKLIVGSSTYIERVKATLLPRTFALEPNAPNPFNPTTTIRFALPQTVPVRLVVYNILGQEVTVLVDQVMPAGYHQVVWDGTNRSGQRVASGVYVYAIQAGTFRQSRKMALVK